MKSNNSPKKKIPSLLDMVAVKPPAGLEDDVPPGEEEIEEEDDNQTKPKPKSLFKEDEGPKWGQAFGSFRYGIIISSLLTKMLFEL